MDTRYESLAAAVAALLVAGCTTPYKPAVYELTEDRIPVFRVAGTVDYVNVQSPGVKQTSGITLHSYEYGLGEVTDAFNRQLAAEVAKRAPAGNSDKKKTIKSKVTLLRCEEPSSLVPTFMMTCEMAVEIQTGDGRAVLVAANQNAPLMARAGRNGVERCLDGTIAIAVIEALKDATLLAYLAD